MGLMKLFAGSGGGSMTVPQFNGWIEKLKRFRGNATRGAMQRIGKYIREQHKARLKAHVGPDGAAWKPTFSAPRPRVGERVPMIVGPGAMGEIGPKQKLQSARTGRYPAVVTETIRSMAGKARAVAFRQRYGPPFKPDKALIRTSGKHRARRIWDFLTRAGSGAVRVRKDGLEYGYTRGMKWIEALHHGGQYREGSSRSVFRAIIRRFRGAAKVPARPIVGLSRTNVEYIEQYLADRYQEYAMKQGGGE